MHRINRSEVELHTGEAALARALFERIGRIYGSRIAPVLDRVCSELNASEAPVRIDRLDLDLGGLAADDLEDAFVARLEPALRAALQEALRRRIGGDRSARDSLELLETFALTGSLPWWAPPDREVVARHFARASAEAGADLVTLLARIARDPGALDRIARLCGRNTLAALIERARADPRPSRTGEPIRDPSAAPPLPPATRSGERDASGRPDLHEGTRSAGQPSANPRVVVDEARRRQRAEQTPLDEPQARARDLVHRDPAPSSDVPPVHAATVAASSAAAQGIDDEPRPSQQDDPAPLDPPRSPAQPRVEGVSVPPRVAARGPRALAVPADPAARRAVHRGAPAGLDELYVEDAGLVILWPFLERFFLRAGVLAEGRRFLDEAAQLQAVALVDSLATADPAPLEFRLPLAKLLCGRPFASGFVLDRPLAPEQLAEGDRLLAAVIDRVPALDEPSIPELRAGFLARPGVLGARDGAWLLQVERRPHDAVLKQFPWSWGWVRLPWMPGPLRVEW